MERFPDCLALVPSLRKPGVSVEKELARLQGQAKTFPYVNRELAAIRYYLHLALWQCQDRWYGQHRGITNYATLLREIERWRFEVKQRVCFVTFNYDTMLERAMRQVLHLSLEDLNSYIGENYVLIKLHGSINWGREVDAVVDPADFSQQDLIDAAATLNITDRYRVVTNCPMLFDGDRVVFPALSIPVENKDEFSCPQAHVEALKRELPKVTKFLTIGWRATEADFLKMLRSKLTAHTHLMIVSGDDNGVQETARNLDPTGELYHHKGPISNGFTVLILNSDKLDAFLRSPRN